jgi:DNA-binding MurR/RpiR family transcriptional regulator
MDKDDTFDGRRDRYLANMTTAQQRVARAMQASREELLIASVPLLAEKACTSEAAVSRTIRKLGFSDLEQLQQHLAAELRANPSLAGRLAETTSHIGEIGTSALEVTLRIHLDCLNKLRRDVSSEAFLSAVRQIINAGRIAVFGIGPSSAVAEYFVMQLMRFGFEAISLQRTGSLFADDLLALRRTDALVILAYGDVYRELTILLDDATERRLSTMLITDTLVHELRSRVDLVLPVPRGKSGLFSMHTATMGLVEALLVGVAAERPDKAISSLKASARHARAWSHRTSNRQDVERPGLVAT